MALINQTQQEYYDNEDYGNYQFTSLKDIVNQFIVAYVGEDKLISKVKRIDVAYHAQRALQELSFDVFKSCKSQEFEVPPFLTVPLPQDYINYTKISSVDSSGIKHIIYPTSKTSFSPSLVQDSDGEFKYTVKATVATSELIIKNKKLYGLVGTDYQPQILGTKIKHPAFPEETYVSDFNVQGEDTHINIHNGSQRIIDIRPYSDNLSINDEINITFVNPQGSLHIEYTPSIIGKISTVIPTVSNNYLELTSADDAVDVKVGMLVEATVGATSQIQARVTSSLTRVTGIVGNKIYIDKPTIPGPLSGSSSYFITFTPVLKKDIKSDTWENYKSHKPSENNINDYQDYQNDIYWPNEGRRFGLDPQYAQVNGSYYIDCNSGKIYFSSNLSGKTVILDYISDSLGTDEEMKVHKFAEEAMYKCIAYAILSVKPGVPEYVIRRYKKERFAETRKAKLRLSNIKLEEITQIFRGKSKQIKH